MTKTIEGIVLVGGMGERMNKLTQDKQKCLLDVEGEPALHWIVTNLLLAFGSVDLKVAVGYRADDVKEFLNNRFGRNRAVTMEYVPHRQGAGTLTAYKSMIPHVKGDFIGVPGDVITPHDTYCGVATVGENNDLVLAVTDKTETVDSHGLVTGNNGIIQSLTYPAPHSGTGLRDMNIYMAKSKVMDELQNYPQDTGAFTNFVQSLLFREGFSVKYYQSDQDFLHLAYPADLVQPVPRSRNVTPGYAYPAPAMA